MSRSHRPGEERSVQNLLRRLCTTLLSTENKEVIRKVLCRANDTLIFPYDIVEFKEPDESLTVDKVAFSLSCRGHQSEAAMLRMLSANFSSASCISVPESGSTIPFRLEEHGRVLRMLFLLAQDLSERTATELLTSSVRWNDDDHRHRDVRTSQINVAGHRASWEGGGEPPATDAFSHYPSHDFCEIGASIEPDEGLPAFSSAFNRLSRAPCTSDHRPPSIGELFGAVSHGGVSGAADSLEALLALPLLSDSDNRDLLSRSQNARIGHETAAGRAADVLPAQHETRGGQGLDSSVLSSQSTLDAWRDVCAAADSLEGAEKRRWWEDTRESSFAPSLPLSELGRDKAEDTLQWWEDGVSGEYGSESLLPEALLVADVVYLLLGLGSRCFECSGDTLLRLRRRLRVQGCAASAVGGVLDELCVAGTHVRRLEAFVRCNRSGQGKVVGSFCEGLSDYLQHYREHILSLDALILQRRAEDDAVRATSTVDPEIQFDLQMQELSSSAIRPLSQSRDDGRQDKSMTLLEVYVQTHAVRQQLQVLATVARCDVAVTNYQPEDQPAERRQQLLATLCRLVEGAEGASAALLRGLLSRAMAPFLSTLHGAVFFADVSDPQGEFLLTQDRTTHVEERQYHEAFALRSVDDCPDFLVPVRTLILRTLQGLTVLRRFRPAHPISSAVASPELRLEFTPRRVRRELARHQAYHWHVERSVERAAREEARAVRKRQLSEQREFRKRVQGLMRQYQEIEQRERAARLERRAERSALGRELEAQAQERREEAARAAALEAALERSVVAETDMFGAESAAELARLKEAAAAKLMEEYAARMQRLKGDRDVSGWPERRRKLHDKRVTFLIEDLRRMRDQMLDMITGVGKADQIAEGDELQAAPGQHSHGLGEHSEDQSGGYVEQALAVGERGQSTAEASDKIVATQGPASGAEPTDGSRSAQQHQAIAELATKVQPEEMRATGSSVPGAQISREERETMRLAGMMPPSSIPSNRQDEDLRPEASEHQAAQQAGPPLAVSPFDPSLDEQSVISGAEVRNQDLPELKRQVDEPRTASTAHVHDSEAADVNHGGASPTPSQVASPTPSQVATPKDVSWGDVGGGGASDGWGSPAVASGQSPYSREPTASPWLRRAAAAIEQTEALSARLMSEEPLSTWEEAEQRLREDPNAETLGPGNNASFRSVEEEEEEDEEEEEAELGLFASEGADGMDDDEEEAEEEDEEQKMLPLSVAVDQCILQPLVLQYRQVSGAVVDLFLDDLKLEDHLRALRRFMFAEEGNWADVLARRIFADGAPRAAGNHHQLLQEALAETRHDTDPFAHRLSLDLGSAADQQAAGRAAGGEGVRLSYHVEWPLSIVLHPASLAQYQRVLGFLLEMRRAINCLDAAWIDLKEHKSRESSAVLAQCHATRHRMLHLCSVVQQYLLAQLLHTSWHELQASLHGRRRPTDLQELVERHDAYIAAVVDKALLSPRTSSVLEIVRAALGTVVAFGSVLSRLSSAPPHHHPALLAQVRENQAAFEGYAGFLYKVVSLMLQKGRSKQQHLEELLLRLDFNGHYARAMSTLSTDG